MQALVVTGAVGVYALLSLRRVRRELATLHSISSANHDIPDAVHDRGVQLILAACDHWEKQLQLAQGRGDEEAKNIARRVLSHLYAAVSPVGGFGEDAMDAAKLMMAPMLPGSGATTTTTTTTTTTAAAAAAAAVETAEEALTGPDTSALPCDAVRLDTLESPPLNNANTVSLYEQATQLASQGKLACRKIRLDITGCRNETDFLACVAVLRRGFDRLLMRPGVADHFRARGLSLMKRLLYLGDNDAQQYEELYFDLMDFVARSPQSLMDELRSRRVQELSFYDVAICFGLLDSFDDVNNPPSAVLSVMQNSWIPLSVKKTAINAAVGAVISSKKASKGSGPFIDRYYACSQAAAPTLAIGFLGPPSELNRACLYFKSTVEQFVREIFDVCRRDDLTTDEHAADQLHRISTETLGRLENV